MAKFIACCIVGFGIAVGVVVGITRGAREGLVSGVLAWLLFGGIETVYVLYTNRLGKWRNTMRKKLRVGLGMVQVALGLGAAVWACIVSTAVLMDRVPVLVGLLVVYLVGAFVAGIGVGTCAEGIRQIINSPSDRSPE